MSHNRFLGDHGEDIACHYLEERGYRIVERQWRAKGGEIDIVAQKNNVSIFVEVKTRRSTQFGYPEEAVTSTKIAHFLRAVEWYRLTHRLTSPCRMDVIAITYSGTTPQIRHIEDVTGGA